MDTISIGKRLKDLRTARKMSQDEVAKRLNVGRTTYVKYENGSINPSKKIQALAQLFNVSTDYLLGRDESAPEEDSAYKKRIPILGTVVAGNPQYAYQDIEGWEEIDTRYAPYKTGDFFALTVKGSSMSPRMEEGDVIIVRVQDYIRAGEIAVVVIGDEATVKEVREAPDGDGICLVGANVAVYKPHLYSRNDIESEGMRICGKVVEMRRRF